MDLNATKKLFHAIVVIGMAATASCSSDSSPDPQDAASNDSSSSNDSGGNKDVAVADTGGGTDAGGDGFTGWLGC